MFDPSKSATGKIAKRFANRWIRQSDATGRLSNSWFAPIFEQRPAAIVVGSGRLGPTHVFSKFLELISDDSDIAMVSSPCSNATEFMQSIIAQLGFETGRLSLRDLEGVLDLFLGHQRKLRRRTVIAVSEFHTHGWWVLDKIRRLIENEAEDRNGLLVMLSGPPSSAEVLDEPVLDIIAGHAGDKIVLMPFTLSETRDFVRRHVTSGISSNGNARDIGELIDFYATNLIHEVCEGVPDDVYRLCKASLELNADSGGRQITTTIVKDAAIKLGLIDAETESCADNGDESPEIEPLGHLIVECVGEPAQQVSLEIGKVVVGRDGLCDHCISGLRVSRFHSMFTLTHEGVVVADLGSTNGTFVNGDKIERYTLDPDDIVGIGHARIRYVPGGERLTQFSSDDTGSVRFTEQFQESSVNFVGDRFKLIKTT